MSDFKKRFDSYKPRVSCKGCEHYENGDWDTDKCLKIECDDRCDDEPICMNAIENFYNFGGADMLDEFSKALYEAIREDTCGCANDAKVIISEIAHKLKEKKNEPV